MLRITGGELRGRSVRTLPNLKTRPTQARLRQALFNSLQLYIPDAKVLDLFAGSGSLSFEAISRGAARAVAVESAKPAVQLIHRNAQDLGVADRLRVVTEPVGGAWGPVLVEAPFDVALADPPYAEGWELKLLTEAPWDRILVPEGMFCLEWGALKSEVDLLPEETPFLVKVREKNYGDSVLTTYRRKPEGSS